MAWIQNRRVGVTFKRCATVAFFMAAGSLCAYGGDVVGKVVVGYQGWLSAPNDGSLVNKWKHTNMECWPSVSEYTTTYSGCTFYQAGVLQSAFNGNLGNGQPAKMCSNWNDQTVNKHFEWMKTYEIDCAAVQRFGSELKDSNMKAYRDGIANKVKTAAQTHGRKYYIMYDISSWDAFQSEIKTDWSNTMRSHTNSSAYAKENGKPVVCIWGIGFSDRPGNATSWTDVINWFKGQGCYVIGGVSGKFDTDTANQNVYKACNMLMSWRVGSNLDPYTVFGDELAWCKNNGIAYQGDIYAGTAFYNTDSTRNKNHIPRMHGDFMWKQFAAAKNKGINGIYISMFDEVQEATQIFKVAENASQVPAGKYFLTLDADGVACSSDFYLRLTQDGGKMFKGQIAYTTAHPTAHVVNTMTTVPWVTNLAESAAGTAITNAGLIVGGVSRQYHATIASGKISSQTPGGKTSVARGSSVALAVSLGPQPQLVKNGSFETNTASWNLAGSSIRSTASAASGVASLRMNSASSYATQQIAVVVGKTYDISVKVNVATRTGGMVVFDTRDQYDADGQGQFTFTATTGGWQTFSGSFTATSSSVTLRMFTDAAFVGTVYFDLIELKPRP